MCIDNIEFSTNSDRILKKDINILIYIIINPVFSQRQNLIYIGNLCGKLCTSEEKIKFAVDYIKE